MTEASDGPGDLHVATVVINVQDMRRAVDFWCAALGYRQREAEMDPEFVMLIHPEDRHLPYPDDADFVVLRDPDGNEFCVIDHVDL